MTKFKTGQLVTWSVEDRRRNHPEAGLITGISGNYVTVHWFERDDAIQLFEGAVKHLSTRERKCSSK